MTEMTMGKCSPETGRGVTVVRKDRKSSKALYGPRRTPGRINDYSFTPAFRKRPLNRRTTGF